ncbi:MAG: DUF3857 domain-containing protein [Terriglobales bacterium]
MTTGAGAYLQAAQSYLADAANWRDDAAAFSGEDVIELYHLRYEQVLPNGLSAVVVQRIFQLRTRAAAKLFALDDLWYDSSRSRFDLVRARVLRRGGKMLTGTDRGDLHPGETGTQPREVALPRLHAGDRVEVLYLLLPDPSPGWELLGGRFLGNLFAFRDTFPTLRAQYVLAAPPPLADRLTFSAIGVAPARRGGSAAGAATWTWEAVRQPAYFRGSDGGSITDRSPFVQVSGFASWAAMADWYNDLLAPRARLSPALQRRLLQLVPPLAPAEAGNPAAIRATVDRAWRYLAGHLDYRGNESGIHAYVPAPVGEIFESGAGDCKDGALLLATWLRAAGVEADLALVRTPIMGQLAPGSPDGRVAATVAAFDHALVYIPATQQWIDTTAPGSLESGLPSSDQNGLALIVRTGQRNLIRVPATVSAAARLNLLQLGPAPASGR